MRARGTVVLLGVLIALCLGYWLMVRFEAQGGLERHEAKRLFRVAPEDVVTIEVRGIDESPSAAERAGNGLWAFTKPHPTIEPNQVLWDRVAAAIAGLTNERTIETSPGDLAVYGLDDPVLEILAGTAEGADVHVAFGAAEPTQTRRYACLLDAEGAADSVFLVSTEAFHELNRPRKLLRNPYLFNLGEAGITRLEFAHIWTPERETQSQDDTGRPVGEESAVVAVQREDGAAWRMVSPFAAEANQDLVGELIKEVQFATGRNHVDEPEALSDYGLDPPRARITVYGGPGEDPQTAYLGSIESAEEGGGLFVKRASKPAVFVIDAQVLTLIPKAPSAFRENRLLTRPATELQSIHYRTDATDLTLVKDPDTGWAIVRPPYDDTDQAAVSNFISLLKALEGRGFPGDAEARFDRSKPVVAIELTFQNDEEPARILVGSPVPDADRYYATQDNGTVVLLASIDVTALTKTAFDFRTKALMTFNRAAATRLELTIEGQRYVFTRPRGRWVVREPAERQLESPSDVDALLQDLQEARAMTLEAEPVPQDLSPYGLDAPLATVVVSTKEAGQGDQDTVHGPLQIGAVTPANSQRRFAVVAGRDGVYTIRQAVVDAIRDTIKGVR